MQRAELAAAAASREAALVNALAIMLQEAGSRATPRDAVCVISGVLATLAHQDYPELSAIARNWASLDNG